ncbi:VOC family protein [Streptomyces sp. NPDC006879]|uniref:VOC family protein n=1 Tax=Streptomyces sp. NPDC006879 TaxID=3364767 RepID=UPI00368EA5EE
MIKGLGIAAVWTLDQERTMAFFTQKLGFEVRNDITFGGVRRLTVGAKGQPEVELALLGPGHDSVDAESARALRTLISGGVLGAAGFRTDDCFGDYETFRERGVRFLQEPRERPWGIEAIFRDEDGNWYALTERLSGDLDPARGWGDVVGESC